MRTEAGFCLLHQREIYLTLSSSKELKDMKTIPFMSCHKLENSFHQTAYGCTRSSSPLLLFLLLFLLSGARVYLFREALYRPASVRYMAEL